MRRGIGHVEVIVAFVLFIGFLIFGLYFFNPLSGDRVLDSSLFYTVDEITKNASTSLLTYGIAFDSNLTEPRVRLALSREDIPGLGCIAERPDGTSIPASCEGGSVSLDRQGAEFVYIRFGEFVPNATSVDTPVLLTSGQEYTVASSEQKDILNERDLLLLNQSYYDDYVDLQESFNVPRRVDFSVTVTFSPEDMIVLTRPVPEGFDVVSQVERKEIMRTDGRVVFADLSVSVW